MNSGRKYIPVLLQGDFLTVVGRASNMERDGNNVLFEVEIYPEFDQPVDDLDVEEWQELFDTVIAASGLVMVGNVVKYGVINSIYLFPQDSGFHRHRKEYA